MLRMAPLFLLLLAGVALCDRDLSRYTAGRPVPGPVYPGIMPLGGRSRHRAGRSAQETPQKETRPVPRPSNPEVPPKSELTRPVLRPDHRPHISQPAPEGHVPVQTLPAELPDESGSEPAPSQGPLIFPETPEGHVPVQTLPARVPESRSGQLPPKSELTRPVLRPGQDRQPQISQPAPDGHSPVQTLPAEVDREERGSEVPDKETRPVDRPDHKPHISPPAPEGHVPVQTLPAPLPEARRAPLPPHYQLTKPVPRPGRG